jgi:hypothetical protein
VNHTHTQAWDVGTCASRAHTFVEWASEPVLRRPLTSSSNSQRPDTTTLAAAYAMRTIGRTGSEAHSTDAAETSTVNHTHTQAWDVGTCASRAHTFVEWASEPVLRRPITLSNNSHGQAQPIWLAAFSIWTIGRTGSEAHSTDEYLTLSMGLNLRRIKH